MDNILFCKKAPKAPPRTCRQPGKGLSEGSHMNTAQALVPSLPDLRLKDLIDRFDLLLRSKCEIESRGVPTQFWSDFFTAPGNVQKNVVDQISDYLAILEDASR
jgi:hypothetical protein